MIQNNSLDTEEKPKTSYLLEDLAEPRLEELREYESLALPVQYDEEVVDFSYVGEPEETPPFKVGWFPEHPKHERSAKPHSAEGGFARRANL